MVGFKSIFGKNTRPVSSKPEIEKPRHHQFNALDETAWQVDNKRLAWLFRGALMTNFVQLAIIGILGSVIIDSLPKPPPAVALVTADELEDKIIRIEPISPQTSGHEVVVQYSIKQFLNLILAVDSNTEKAQRRLNEAVYFLDDRFMAKWNTIWLTSADYKEMMRKNISRQVDVGEPVLIQRIGNMASYAVDYDFIDRKGFETIQRGTNRITVFLELRPQEVAPEAKYENLAGVFITDIAFQEMKNERF